MPSGPRPPPPGVAVSTAKHQIPPLPSSVKAGGVTSAAKKDDGVTSARRPRSGPLPPPPPAAPIPPPWPKARPTAMELAVQLGDRSEFRASGIEIIHNQQHDGGCRIGVRLHNLSRPHLGSRSIFAKFPDVDAQVTLVYTKSAVSPRMLDSILEELRRRATLPLAKNQIIFKAEFQASGAQPECAWMNIKVLCDGYRRLQDFAGAVKGLIGARYDGMTWGQPYFSLVLTTPPRPAEWTNGTLRPHRW